MKNSKPSTSKASWKWPFIGALSCLVLGLCSGATTPLGLGWYALLNKAPGNPPPWVFGPVWICLYIMMGISLGRLINRKDSRSIKLFAVQFVLNLAWSPVFFLFQQVEVALAVIFGMWLFLIATILSAQKTDALAARLLFPYLAWVTYATYLNAGILWLN